MAARVVTFGEIMLRLSPPGYQRFLQASSYRATFGGAEANVAVSMAIYGLESRFVSKVPAHEIGQCAVNALRGLGVDTSRVLRGGERLGVYFCETGASHRPSRVIYDRRHSAIAEADPGEFGWRSILDGVDWFHVSGITPGISQKAAQATLDAVTTARSLSVKVSLDVNYRRGLWSFDEAGRTLAPIMEYVDLAIMGPNDPETLFGICPQSAGATKPESLALATDQLRERFGISKAAFTVREGESASDNTIRAFLCDDEGVHASRDYKVHIIDRVGSGDSFAGALIYSLLGGVDGQRAVDFAIAASCFKHSIEGDFNLVDLDEVRWIASNEHRTRIRR